jgi:hypothetical protein
LDFREFIGVFADFRPGRNDHKESKEAGKGKSTGFQTPCTTSVTVDDRHQDPMIQKSIDPTREYDSSDLKENGTIPFYATFLKNVFIREFRELFRSQEPGVRSWNGGCRGAEAKPATGNITIVTAAEFQLPLVAIAQTN